MVKHIETLEHVHIYSRLKLQDTIKNSNSQTPEQQTVTYKLTLRELSCHPGWWGNPSVALLGEPSTAHQQFDQSRSKDPDFRLRRRKEWWIRIQTVLLQDFLLNRLSRTKTSNKTIQDLGQSQIMELLEIHKILSDHRTSSLSHPDENRHLKFGI